jgi:hypothetical protein
MPMEEPAGRYRRIKGAGGGFSGKTATWISVRADGKKQDGCSRASEE